MKKLLKLIFAITIFTLGVNQIFAQSKRYTLGSGWIGNLIIFNSSVASHYESSLADGIQMAYNGDQTI